MIINREQAEQFLTEDIDIAMNDVNKLFRVQLSKNQKEALVSFLFNFGEPQLRGSTLVKQINAKLDPNTVAKAQFPRWIHITKILNKGQPNETKVVEVSPGLVIRRIEELAHFCS